MLVDFGIVGLAGSRRVLKVPFFMSVVYGTSCKVFFLHTPHFPYVAIVGVCYCRRGEPTYLHGIVNALNVSKRILSHLR